MKEDHSNQKVATKAYDLVSRTKFFLASGQIIVQAQGKPEQVWNIPSLPSLNTCSHRNYLHFATVNSSHLQINPWGNLLVCKSQRVQEADLSETYTSGQVWWQLFVPHTTLALTVGVKDKKRNRYVSFDFSFKTSTRLAFKLNLKSKTFKVWINGVESETKPTLSLSQECSWTPFVRIRQSGATLSLNPFVDDPENKNSQLNYFINEQAKVQALKSESTVKQERLSFKKNESFISIRVEGQKLFLIGSQGVSWLDRNQDNRLFQLDRIVQVQQVEGEQHYVVKLEQGQVDILQKANKFWDVNLLPGAVTHQGNFWLKRTKPKWLQYLKNVFNFLDNQLIQSKSGLVKQTYSIVISLLSRLSYSLNLPQRVSRWNPIDRDLLKQVDRLSFYQSKSLFEIKQETAHNLHSLEFSQKIIDVYISNGYLSILLENNKISIYSICGIPFKIGDYIISKSIKKHNQLTECAKEADQIRGTLGQPTIYKILKNCLKYADKVKPPEKLVKDLEIKRQKLREKEKKPQVKEDPNKLIPDKNLESTLIQMGFGIKIVQKALIQCKNASLEAAMDLILGGTIVIEEEKVPTPSNDWTCQSCTLVNKRTNTVCAACDAHMPIFFQQVEKIQVKKEQAKQQQQIDEEITSEKIQQTLKGVYVFPTGLAIAPIIVAGVFSSGIRFRLFALNPKFFSSCYEAGDLFADLINHNYYKHVGVFPSEHIQKILNYISPQESKQRCLSWIPIQDFDYNIKQASQIKLKLYGFHQQNLRIKAQIVKDVSAQDLYFTLNTNKVYFQKKRSLVLSPNVKDIISKLNLKNQEQKQSSNKYILNYTNSAVDPSEFQVILQRNNIKKYETIEQNAVAVERSSNNSSLNLYVHHSPQYCNYPEVNFSSPWKSAFKNSELWRNSLILKTSTARLVQFQCLMLELANKQDKIQGYYYFTNDYQLHPSKIYRFIFNGTSKKLYFDIPKIKSLYLVVGLEPHHQDKLIQLTQIQAFGEQLDENIPNPKSLKICLKPDIKMKIEYNLNNTLLNLVPRKIQAFLLNPTHDLSVGIEIGEQKILEYSDLRVLVHIQTCTEVLISLKEFELQGFTWLRVNAIKNESQATKSAAEIQSQFNESFNEYMLTRSKICLRKLISSQYASRKDKANLKNFSSFLNEYIISLPYDHSQLNHVQALLGLYMPSIIAQKENIKLKKLIYEGLRSNNLTANGFQILLWLNKKAEVLSAQDLTHLIAEIIIKLKNTYLAQNDSKQYNIFDQKSIFSPYLHFKGSRQEAEKFDKITSRVILQKLRYSKIFTIDLFSCYSLRELQLSFDKSLAKNKLLVNLRWFNANGESKGIQSFMFNYSVWSSCAGDKRASKRLLSIPLTSYNITTRYLQVEISFTLQPFTATKAEVTNLPQNQIVPAVYGNFIGQTDVLPQFLFQFEKKNLQFVRKLGKYSKYLVNSLNKKDLYLFEEEDPHSEVLNAQLLKQKLDLHGNKQKWLNLMMQKPSISNLNYLYTFFTTLSHQILKSKNIGSVNNDVLQGLVKILNKQVGFLHETSQRILILLIQKHTILAPLVFSYQFQAGNLQCIFTKYNPLTITQCQQFILRQLQKGNSIVAKNCLCLIDQAINENNSLKDIAIQLLDLFVRTNLNQQAIQLIQKVGWIQGVNKLIERVIENDLSNSLFSRILKSSKKETDILNYLLQFLANQPPSEYILQIFDELTSRLQSTKLSGNKLYQSFFKWIISDRQEELPLFDLLSKLIKGTKCFDLDIKTIQALFKSYFDLQQRNILWNQIKSLPLLKQKDVIGIIIDLATKQMDKFLEISKQKRKANQHQLLFIQNIFKATFNHQNFSQINSDKLGIASHKILSKILITELNWGGRQGSRFLNESSNSYLAIAYYIANLSTPSEAACLENQNLLRWYIHNLNKQQQLIPLVSGYFNSILKKVWSIIVEAVVLDSKYVTVLQIVIKESLKQASTLNKTNRFSAVLLRTKVFQFMSNLLRQLNQKSQGLKRISHLLGECGFFNTLLSTIEGLKDLATEENQVALQRELANQLKLCHQQKPQDWLLYRNGAKNHVFEVLYEGKNSHSLMLQRQYTFWPAVIAIGFQTNSGSNTVYAPKEVLVEIGQNKNKLDLVGALQLIPFDSFGGYSVKVYAINLFRLKLRNSAKFNFNQCKILKLTFVSPYQYSSQDSAELKNSLAITKHVSYINFLSITGYARNGPNLIPQNLSTLMQIIQQLCQSKYISDLKKLLQNSVTFDLFTKSLKSISFLLSTDSFGNIAHKFLLRVCEVNAALGENMLSTYLDIKNPILSAKMAQQITLSSREHSVNRAKRFFSYITNRYKQGSKDAEILPFINRFASSISTLIRNYHLQPALFQTLEYDLSDQFISSIIKNSVTNLSYKRLAQILLLSSPPLIFKVNNKEKIWQEFYQSNQPTFNQLLAILINSDLSCRQWFSSNKYLAQTFKKIIDNLKLKEGSISLLTSKLKFITLLCRNRFIKEEVTKAQMDLQIFELLVNSNSQGLLARSDSKQLREGLVNFIASASLDSPNQRIIGALLKDSLNAAVLQSSSQFVGQVFLPLLNSYSKTAVCLIPYSSKENRVVADFSSLQKYHVQTKQQIRKDQKFRLDSIILSEEAKNSFFQKLSVLTGHKWGSFRLVTNHGQLSATKHLQKIKESLARNKTILILLQTKSTILGILYHSFGDVSQKNRMNLTKGSFLFRAQKEIIVLSQNNMKQKVGQFVKNEDSVDQLNLCLNGKIVGEIRYDGNGGSLLHTSFIKQKAGTKQEAVNSAEYWELDTQSIESYESVWANQKIFAKKLLSQLTQVNFFRPEFKTSQSVQLLRQQPLFQFPSTLTIKQLLSAIQILGRNSKIGANYQISLANGTHPNNTATLQHLAKSQSGELILDLLIDLEGVVQNLELTAAQKKAQFLPIRGILKYFEENEGVKSMIKAIKKSVGDWKNLARKEKWLQYINQLEKFSGFPHFFGVYLRQKETFELLLELLSGLPDKETDTKWDQKQTKSSQRLLKIVSDILNMENSQQFRTHALKHDFLITILQRLKILSGTFVRHFQAIVQEQVVNQSPNKGETEDDGTKKIKKKKGVGYSQDTNSNTKWMKGENFILVKKQFQSIEPILMLIEGFLGGRSWKAPHQLLKQLLNSCLLPYLEQCLRAGTLLQMSKHPEKYRAVLKLVRSLARQQNLVSALIPLPHNYQPAQNQSIQSLLKSLFNTSKIFLSCLGQNLSKEDKLSQQLANDIIETYNLVEDAVAQLAAQGEEGVELQNVLTTLPLDKKYRILLRELRFDYIDMKDSPTKIKHHYASYFQANYQPNQAKMIRLAQELADISTALPHEHTNAIYVRCDKDRVDYMQALIMGSNGTPYGHGAFLFDIYFDDNYPTGPPKVNLTTTGHGKIRFNPNLYACGKVCLSLLGTWRGSASQSWDPKVSTLLQVLLSIQAIIMSQEVYFNEPGFQNEQGTEQGEKRNEAYSNIVRYGNVKFAMLENIKNPPKGFEAIIRRHFYLKKNEIIQQCRKWLRYAEKRPANYIGLVNDHNSSWSTQFKKSKNQYKQMLQKTIKQLEEEFAKLPAPSLEDLASKQTVKKAKKKKQVKDLKSLQLAQHQQIDVSYESKMLEDRQLDINDQKVKDRWSRYIGAMGIDAVSRQAKADILVLGLGPFALQVIKNLVLSGCRKLTVVDQSLTKLQDLSGGFFYQESDIGKKRVDAILYKIRELNCYVKVDTISKDLCTPEVVQKYTLVLATQLGYKQQIQLSKICRQKKIKFISADCFGAACRITNDFGKFEVLDRNGEESVQVMIKDIEISERGLVTLLDGSKHPYEDGEAIVINNIQGMRLIQDKNKSINGVIRKIKTISFKSFEIGDTRMFQAYIRNGTIKNIKTPVNVDFPPLQNAFDPKLPLDLDPELTFYDFAKEPKSAILRLCFITLDQFREHQKRILESWNKKDADLFITYLQKNAKEELNKQEIQFATSFAFSCKGHLPPLCAFFGGFVAQQVIKGITQKYKPVLPSFYLNFLQLLPKRQEGKQWDPESLSAIYTKGNTRDQGFASVVGRSLVALTAESRIFMIGAGAIGCQLLKNFAMVGLGSGENGKIILTDPDHIQNSNLNRQFLFREKHISKPKSLTAAASVTLMNPTLKSHITPLLQRVSQSTREIFSNRFFGGLTAVTNALDNVAARRYVDQRCVQNQVALFDSGTLGPKGHVQVVIPFKTQSYGSQNDPAEEGEIPHCTLKLFPEETLHCIQWARDIFGRKFTLQPKALNKFLEKGYIPQSGDIKTLTQSLKMVTKGPKLFDDCLEYAINKFYKYYRDDIMQLLYTYPLDAKTKNGEPFWRLPKRPPTPILKFDPEDPLQATFVMSLAVLMAKIYQIPFPPNFRTEKQRLIAAKQASKIKVKQFIPSDQLAKAILKQTATEEKKKEGEESEQTDQKITEVINSKSQVQLHKDLLANTGAQYLVKSEEFEKDDDANGHIDFIYAAANLRAMNYKLEPMDWISTKIKAGRIVPALATTTSCVAGLQTLQLLKYLKKLTIQNMKNSYLNLAVPNIQMSEPGQPKKKKLKQGLSITLWDKWEVICKQDVTFGEIYQKLKKQYGLFPIGVLQGMSRIDFGKGETEKKKFLSSKVLEKLQREAEQQYLDIVVLFTESQQDEKILEGIPPVRLRFVKK